MRNIYRVTFKGRATRSPLNDTAKETFEVDATDLDQARQKAADKAAAGMRLDGVNCDLVTVANVAKVKIRY